MKYFLWLLLGVWSFEMQAQTDSLRPTLSFSGYMDGYYGYDFNRPVVNNYTRENEPDHHLRPTFLYNHNRHNEFNVNLALVQATYVADRVRGSVGIQVGTYAQYNYAGEEGLLRNVYEARAGIQLVQNLWLDAGVFASHIGAESAISKDCWTLTRSISAENTPYYLSGAKLSYASAGKAWSFTGLVLNGWQRIRENNAGKAVGTQVQFKPNSTLVLNSSTFIGNEQAQGTPARSRYFHDFYFTWQSTERLGLVDVGIERNAADNGYSRWWSWVLIARYRIGKEFFLAGRIENYTDPDGVIVASTSGRNGFRTTQLPGGKDGFALTNFSTNLDYRPADNVLLRFEARLLRAHRPIFVQDGDLARYSSFAPSLATSLALSF